MSSLTESLAQTRHAERYRPPNAIAAPGARGGRLHGTRTRAGWALIGLGLRLALPGSRKAARRITLIGR